MRRRKIDKFRHKNLNFKYQIASLTKKLQKNFFAGFSLVANVDILNNSFDYLNLPATATQF